MRHKAHSFFIRNNAKLWTNIAYAVSTWIVVHMEMTSRTDSTVLLIWMGTVAASELAKRVVAAKFGVTQEEPKCP
jgi:hypothetical protein